MASRKRGMIERTKDEGGRMKLRILQHYTFTRTAVFTGIRGCSLDGQRESELRSAHHDQANQIRQHSGRRPKSGSRFLHEKLGFTIITDQPFDEKQRWIELRIPKAETRVVL